MFSLYTSIIEILTEYLRSFASARAWILRDISRKVNCIVYILPTCLACAIQALCAFASACGTIRKYCGIESHYYAVE